jgi:hypothetical protein
MGTLDEKSSIALKHGNVMWNTGTLEFGVPALICWCPSKLKTLKLSPLKTLKLTL